MVGTDTKNNREAGIISVFYDRSGWDVLLRDVLKWCEERKHLFSCDISLSEDRGDHVRLWIYKQEKSSVYGEIHSYVKFYIEANPSIRSRVLPYGKALWCYYPNNELVFDRFKVNSYAEEITSVRKETLKLYMDLLEGDYSVDSMVAVCLYVFIKLLKLVEKDQIERAVSGIIDEISDNINMYNSTVTVQELIDELLESNDILADMYTYWEEDITLVPTHMQEWLESIKSSIDMHGYPYTCDVICDILGLGKLHCMLIQMLIQMWYSKYKMVIK